MATIKERNRSQNSYTAAEDIIGLKILFVNIFFVGTKEKWFLVDAGLPGFSGRLIKTAEALFGIDNPPEFIFLTHGHFDHVGALELLLQKWDVPIYTHLLELPYLSGKSAYPPPDPAIGGGAMSYMSWLFPNRPYDFKDKIIPVEESFTLPGFSEWEIIFTPGHSPGHSSLWRAKDGILIAGDAVITTDQNSAMAVLTQEREVHGPPAYFTCDWEKARISVDKIYYLHPSVIAGGHGKVMEGVALIKGLRLLKENFEQLAIPSASGRYVQQPAITNEEGIVSMPAPVSYYIARTIGAVSLVSILVASFILLKRKRISS